MNEKYFSYNEIRVWILESGWWFINGKTIFFLFLPGSELHRNVRSQLLISAIRALYMTLTRVLSRGFNCASRERLKKNASQTSVQCWLSAKIWIWEKARHIAMRASEHVFWRLLLLSFHLDVTINALISLFGKFLECVRTRRDDNYIFREYVRYLCNFGQSL